MQFLRLFAAPRDKVIMLGFPVIIIYLVLELFFYLFVFIDYNSFILRALFVAAIVLYLWWYSQNPWHTIRLHLIGPGRPITRDVWITLGGLVVILLVVRAIIKGLTTYQLDFTITDFIEQVILPPISEEIVFRGVFLGIFLTFWKDRIHSSVHLTALIFAVAHFPEFIIQFIWIYIGGLIYGYAYAKTRAIYFPILLHALWNVLAFVPPNSVLTDIIHTVLKTTIIP